MDIAVAVSKILDAFYGMTDEILDKLKQPVGNVTETENSLRLKGHSLNEVVATATEDVTAHTKQKNNPHGLTAAAIGSMDRSSVDAASKIINMDVFPAAFFRAHTDTIIDGSTTSVFDSTSNSSAVSGFTYTVKRSYDVVVGGIATTHDIFTFDLTKIADFDSSIHTWYLYAEPSNGEVNLTARTDRTEGSFNELYIGTITTDSSSIKTVSIWEGVRLGNRWLHGFGDAKYAQSVAQVFSEINCNYISGKSQ